MKGNVEADLSGTVALYMTHAKGREKVQDKYWTYVSNIVYFDFFGSQQKVLGRYTLTVEVTWPNGSMSRTDKCAAFELVGRSCVEDVDLDDYKLTL